MGIFHHKHKPKSWIFYIFPSVKIKTCFQIEGDAVCRQLQATLLITKHPLIRRNRDTAISLQHDNFILPEIVFYYCSMPPRETDVWRKRWMATCKIRRRVDMGGGVLGNDGRVWSRGREKLLKRGILVENMTVYSILVEFKTRLGPNLVYCMAGPCMDNVWKLKT